MSLAIAHMSIPLELKQLFHRNILALHSTQPDVAAYLEICQIPENVDFAIGRDGHPTFRRSDDPGETPWFGGSSMPSISAPEVFAVIPAAGGNVILPAIMTGQEALVLLDRLPRHCAVFVVEHDSANLVLALHLRDFEKAIHTGRLVLFPFAIFENALHALFERCPGYLLPTRMVTSPLLRQDTVSLVQKMVGEIAEPIFAGQRKCIADAQAEWSVAVYQTSHRPTVALVDANFGTPSADRLRDLSTVLTDLGTPFAAYSTSDPRGVHVAMRMKNLAALRPTDAIFINGAPGELNEFLPKPLSTISWYFPGASPTGAASQSSAHAQHVVASSTAQRECLKASGTPADRITVCAVGIGPADPADHTRLAIDTNFTLPACVLVAPEIDDSTQSLNVTLPSHIRLWNRLRDMVADQPADVDSVRAAALVRLAQRDIGMSGDDANIIEYFSRIFLERIAPAEQSRIAVNCLRSCEPATVTFTSGQFIPIVRQTRAKSVHACERSEALTDRPLIVFPCPFAARTECMLEALAAECAVVVFGTTESWLREHPDLVELSAAFTFYGQSAKLSSAVRMAQGSSSITRAEFAHRVRTAHTLAHRLQAILSKLPRLEHSPIPA